VVVASRLVAVAGCAQGLYVQSFPMFGPERSGAPVVAFLRLDTSPIWLRCQIEEPDAVCVFDPTLLPLVRVTAGLRPGGDVILNARRPPAGLSPEHRWHLVDATTIATAHGLGTPLQPLVSTAMAGALYRILGSPNLEAILEAVRRDFPSSSEANAAAAREAYHRVSA
jgi:pyruvate ferredoxin oxidoreductase gamma subunit/2-oxoisovalerate ferredoxin oxidoreductase gamma subunit